MCRCARHSPRCRRRACNAARADFRRVETACRRRHCIRQNAADIDACVPLAMRIGLRRSGLRASIETGMSRGGFAFGCAGNHGVPTSDAHRSSTPLRRGYPHRGRRQPLAGTDQSALLGVRRSLRRHHGSYHPACADGAPAAGRRPIGAHRQLLRAHCEGRIRCRPTPGKGQPLEPALVRGAVASRCRTGSACDRRIRRAPSAESHGRSSR